MSSLILRAKLIILLNILLSVVMSPDGIVLFILQNQYELLPCYIFADKLHLDHETIADMKQIKLLQDAENVTQNYL